MSDAKLERTNVKIEANNHSETASGEVLLFWRFSEVYDWRQEGMLPAMKVSENFTTITGNGAIFKTSCTLYRSFFG
jgi:DNA topoisomerase-1